MATLTKQAPSTQLPNLSPQEAALKSAGHSPLEAQVPSYGLSNAIWTGALVAAFFAVTLFCKCLKTTEFKTTITSEQAIKQSIVLPRQRRPETAYLLVDMGQGQDTAPVNIRINGIELSAVPQPLSQLQPKANEHSQYSSNHWSAVKLPTSAISPGVTNVVTISPLQGRSLTVYGDHTPQATTQPAVSALGRDGKWTSAPQSGQYRIDLLTVPHQINEG